MRRLRRRNPPVSEYNLRVANSDAFSWNLPELPRRLWLFSIGRFRGDLMVAVWSGIGIDNYGDAWEEMEDWVRRNERGYLLEVEAADAGEGDGVLLEHAPPGSELFTLAINKTIEEIELDDDEWEQVDRAIDRYNRRENPARSRRRAPRRRRY